MVPDRLTVFEPAADRESLFIILIGALFVLPVIAGYSVLACAAFRGKPTALRSD